MGQLTPSSIRGIRVIRGSILPLLAVVCFLQFPSSAQAQTELGSPGFFASHSSVDGIDCITADDADEEALVVADNSSGLPNDFDLTAGPCADKADIPSRSNQVAPETTTTALKPITLRPPGFVPAFLFPAHSSDSLPEHLRERAPPALV